MNLLANVFPALSFPGLMLAAIGLVLVLMALVLTARGFRAGPRIERKVFLTRAAVEVLDYLRRVLPEHHVSCQVAMGALLKPQRGLSRKEFWRTRNRFGQKADGPAWAARGRRNRPSPP